MLEKYLPFLVCPVTRSALSLEKISVKNKSFNSGEKEIINEGILFADKDWFYPVIDGVPRLLIESFLDYGEFLKANLPDYGSRKEKLLENYSAFIQQAIKKNKKTKIPKENAGFVEPFRR